MADTARNLLTGEAATIDKVTVSEDSEGRLVVRVSGKRLGGKQLFGEVLGAEKEQQRQVSSAKALPVAEAVEADLAFELTAAATEGTELSSSYLHLSVQGDHSPLPEADGFFQLPKKWRRPVSPEHLRVRVVMRPEGAAAKLREQTGTQPTIVLPSLRKVPRTFLQPRPEGAARVSSPRVVTTRAVRSPQPAAPRAATPLVAVHAAGVNPAPAPKTPVLQPVALTAQGAKLTALSKFKFGLPTEDQGKGAAGPGAMPLDLVSQIGFDVGQDPADVMRIWPQVYQDRNPASGIFYFMPKAYHLYWEPTEGYGLRMLYGAANGEGQAGSVVMAARLDAGVDSADVAFVKDLLRAWQKRNPGTVFTELRRLPIDKPPELSLGGGLEQVYNIPADKIAVNAISDALGEIEVQWVTDSITKENLQIALVEDVGINGNLTFTPSGGILPSQHIPVAIKLADGNTFGDFRWQRGRNWRNETPYPIRLRYMHALLFESDLPIVYSWDLNETIVPPKAQAEFEAAAVPSWLEGRAKRIWLEYAVDEGCQDCDREVVAALTGGVSTIGAVPIIFHTLTPLADLEAAEMSVMVRSRFFEPRRRELMQKGPLVLNADGQDFSIGPLYQDPDATGTLFEYNIELVLKDGSTFSGTEWLPADKLRVVIGKAQIRKSLGRLPGE